MVRGGLVFVLSPNSHFDLQSPMRNIAEQDNINKPWQVRSKREF